MYNEASWLVQNETTLYGLDNSIGDRTWIALDQLGHDLSIAASNQQLEGLAAGDILQRECPHPRLLQGSDRLQKLSDLSHRHQRGENSLMAGDWAPSHIVH